MCVLTVCVLGPPRYCGDEAVLPEEWFLVHTAPTVLGSGWGSRQAEEGLRAMEAAQEWGLVEGV